MTKCNRDRVRFSSHGRKAVEADFSGGTISSDASGALLLRHVESELDLAERISACLPDPRDPSRIEHEQAQMIRQRIIANALGHCDLVDHQQLRSDPALQLAAGAAPDPQDPLASPSTLCRLENRMLRSALRAMMGVMLEMFIASFETPPAELALDFDATDDRVHGGQEQRFYHGYYGDYCFLPLYVFCGEKLLLSYLRPSRHGESLHAWALLKLLTDRLRQVWPNVRIVLRADSGFCRWKLFRWCERHGVHYIVGLPRNSRLERAGEDWMAQAKGRALAEQQSRRVFGELEYKAEKWDKARRVIAKAEYLHRDPKEGTGKANHRYVVTNLPGEPAALYEKVYCQRGEMENRIKEQQLGLFADRTSCHAFLANQWRVLMSGFSYVLLQRLREKVLAGTQLAKAQVWTIREKLLKIAGQVQVTARRIRLRLSGASPHRGLFLKIAAKLLGLEVAPAPS